MHDSPRLDRRAFALGLTSLAFSGLALSACATSMAPRSSAATAGFGPLEPDPNQLLDLPRGFSYRVISAFGDPMDDGFRVPDRADGMGAFRLDQDRVALVRNHELQPKHAADGPFATPVGSGAGFDRGRDGGWMPGGTTTLVYDQRSGRVERQHLSLIGTIRNCAGGTTPWGSWLTCEEDVSRAGDGQSQDHGWVFEVPASHPGRVDAVPLRAMGRFNHEAAAVDPRTGIVYLTEDRDDSLFYRFLPARRGQLAQGGRLQALAFADPALGTDSRNWNAATLNVGQWAAARWIDLDGVDSTNDDLRKRGNRSGAALFARGEGIHFGANELYFCCTSGGAAKLSQVMRYRPSRNEGQPGEADAPGRLQLFVESTSEAMLNFGDNITVAPNGHLIVCEDQYTAVVDNHLRGITPAGDVYAFARLHAQTELAGACFSPDGRTMFVNVYSPGKTLAITGPWMA
ncbi:alkaline phosphatase PhoX [Allosphingosinicella deserti]|uniref:Phosphatase n=1 Tax=Allosphingosinicella deserti TaxID=2116704 RepID=A0A2P7QI89_9SPHN|nr:alkaline phosphatase PhoX [Sphingomonas deserti]PSJ37687.1 phosphatase [Sphingomonas deserti]